MKLTDLALVFVVILLPVVIIVYVNTSYVVRAEREEMYYKNMINSAVTDATAAMKVVENEDTKIDYGYSGILENKVSVNANVAVDTFFTSLYNNLGIKGNAGSEIALKSYIPAIAVIDYDGIYIYSAEEVNGKIEYVLKPKKYFTYMYYIQKTGTAVNPQYEVKEYRADETFNASDANAGLVYHITFTQDDYVYLKVYKIGTGLINDISNMTDAYGKGYKYVNAFYLGDDINNTWLVGDTSSLVKLNGGITSNKVEEIKTQIKSVLESKRREVIAKICMEEISYAVNRHNYYAKKAGVSYNFTFGINSDDDWYETVDGIGMLAIVQGISLGNRYLNYSAYSMSDLISSKRYYLSDSLDALTYSENYYEALTQHKYYHSSNSCPVYEAYIDYINILDQKVLSPSFLYSKEEAAVNGFEPCFICKP